MAQKHKAGGLYTGSHTTCIDMMFDVCDFIEKLLEVKKISLGVIGNTGGKSTGNIRTVKIINEMLPNCVLIRVAQGRSTQEMRFYTESKETMQEAKLKLARWTRNNKWKLMFR